MKNIINNNTLLSQGEIDTLIRFLTNHEQKIQDSVLSQDSIDKLVSLLQKNGDTNLDLFNISSEVTPLPAEDLSGHSLSFTIDDTTGFITIIAHNDGAELIITPLSVNSLKVMNDDSKWGICIEPVIFDKIATIFKLKYTKTTYDKICTLFSTKRYGKADMIIPALYLPTADSIANNMLI
ncbi:MAG: hypothetical protein E7261_01035 [Lachnospiraceae bacterium]|nr:hypothetical protein [Lachnospiraceae bacterium]